MKMKEKYRGAMKKEKWIAKMKMAGNGVVVGMAIWGVGDQSETNGGRKIMVFVHQ